MWLNLVDQSPLQGSRIHDNFRPAAPDICDDAGFDKTPVIG
jgi:hypothetical protein